MYDRVLLKIRAAVREADYLVTRHAKLEMNKDSFTILDLERIILQGEIVERQKDNHTGEQKYRIRAEITGSVAETIVKISLNGYPVVITVYVW